MEVRLDGRTALITGGSLGLGKAMAMMFAESGAKVAIVARRQDVLDETKKEIEVATGGTVGAYSCNVLEKSEIEAAHAAAVNDLGPIDILANNVGTSMLQESLPASRAARQLYLQNKWSGVAAPSLTLAWLASSASPWGMPWRS